jgi:hypothetical protein
MVLVDAALASTSGVTAGLSRSGQEADGSRGGLIGYIEGKDDIMSYALASRHAGLSIISAGQSDETQHCMPA